MEKHRAAVRNFERSNALFELVQRRYDAVSWLRGKIISQIVEMRF